MSRPVKEWIGKTAETRLPPRVKLRILERENHVCHECKQPIHATDKPEFDHRPALINGGENRESKIFPVHTKCHRLRTAKDVHEKAKVAAIKGKHRGISATTKPIAGRPFQTTRKAADRKAKAASKIPVPGPRQMFKETER